MDWPTLLQTLSDSSTASTITELAAHESALQFVLGETTFVLEHDETEGMLLVTGVLGRMPGPGLLRGELLMHFLKTNMRLQGAGLGSIACDPLENEFVWRHIWSMEYTTEREVLEALQQADAMRAEFESEHWLPTAGREYPRRPEMLEALRQAEEAMRQNVEAETENRFQPASSSADLDDDFLTKILAW